MNNKVKWIVLAVLFIGALIVATVLYSNLSEQYGGSNFDTSVSQPNTNEGASSETPEQSDDTQQPPDKTPEQSDEEQPDEEQPDDEQPDEEQQPDADAATPDTEGGTAQEQPPADAQAPAAPTYDFTVQDKDGNTVKLSDYRGKPVVLNFWASWCYYCREEMPNIQALYEKYPDVQFMMVNHTSDSRETAVLAQDHIDRNGYTFDVFFDTQGDAANTFRVTGLPVTYFFDANGKLVARGNGMLGLQTLEKGISMIRED